MKHRQRGFTLIELLVVIAIIGILASVVLSSLESARASARDSKKLSEIRQIQTALEVYRNRYGQYPNSVTNFGLCDPNRMGATNTTGLRALITESFLPALPSDGPSPYCIHYTGPDSTGSSWQCGGKSRSNYPYSIVAVFENTGVAGALAATGNGLPSTTYCFVAP